MNNQFSQRVSDIITYSKEEANRLRNRYIGPEHLLLGMLRDGGGKAIEILLKLDIDLKRVKSRLEGFLKDAEDDTLLPDAEVPLSPMTAKILKMCMLEARLLKSATADTEHVLLAILKDGDNLAATVLEEHRVDYQAVFEQLSMKSTNPNAGMGFTEDDEEDEEDMNMSRSSRTGGAGSASAAQAASRKPSNDTPVLDNFGVDMTRAAEEGKLDRIDTYIGVEGNEFVCVGCAKDLSAPGVIFSYGEYVRFQRANKATYLEFFKQNSRSHIIVDGRAYTIDQFLKLY